jgi:hypothetical protein
MVVTPEAFFGDAIVINEWHTLHSFHLSVDATAAIIGGIINQGINVDSNDPLFFGECRVVHAKNGRAPAWP